MMMTSLLDRIGQIAQDLGIRLSPMPDLGAQTALDKLMASPGALDRVAPPADTHTVDPRETLSSIAKDFGTTWQTLARINGLADPDLIRPGQVLHLPEGATRRDEGGPPTRGSGETGGAGRTGGTRPVDTVRDNAPQGIEPGAASIRAADIAAERAAGRQSIGRCYAWVKTALQQSGAVSDYMPGVAAKGAGPALEQRGFRNILDDPAANIRSPYDAPKGAVLVYGAAPGATDRNAKYGHIEIRTDQGFASDYASARARTGAEANGLEGRGRVLIGVYVKPDAGAATAPGATAPASDAYRAENLNLGANERYRGAITEAAERTGMTPQTVAAIIDAETLRNAQGVWRADAQAGTSSAAGMTQFLKGTWIAEARRDGGVLNTEAKAAGLVDSDNRVVNERALLDARFDARLSILAEADYARNNLASLQRSGHVPQDASPAAIAKYAYLAHHEGLAGARGFISGDMGYLGGGTFEANVPRSQRAQYLNAAGGSEPAAYRHWLSDYTDRRIDVTRFMHNGAGVEVPSTRSLLR